MIDFRSIGVEFLEKYVLLSEDNYVNCFYVVSFIAVLDFLYDSR